MHLDDLTVPDSAAATHAYELADAFCSPALRNHCVRSYLWGTALAAQEGIAIDAELLYVGAMLHDFGLLPSFDHPSMSFEHVGGNIAVVFAAGAGWPVEQQRRVSEVIVRHMGYARDPADDPEGHLLERATTIDVSGGGIELIPAALRTEVLAQWPRSSFAAEFAERFQAQVPRGAELSAGRAIARGALKRMAANPLDAPVQA
ncbi:MAG: HD domain-containing protein [Blastococcus sp.]